MSFSFPKKNIRPLAILTLLLLFAFYDIVFLGKTLKVTTANSQALPTGAYGQENNKPRFIPVQGTDSPVQEEPLYEFIKQNLWQGIVPLWNPHQGCGYPLLGMIEVGVFFPTNYILYLLPEKYSWDVMILLRILLAGMFAFWFMRVLKFAEVPSLGAAITFMLSGPMVLIQFWTVNVDLLLPVVLIACERLSRKADTQNLLFLAIAAFLTILAGHPEHIFLINGFGFLFFAYRLGSLYVRNPAAQNYRSNILFYIYANILALGLGAFVLFPFLQNFLFEFWHGHPKGTGLIMEEQPGRAITIALPHFFQQVPLTFKWEYSGWWGGYLGTLPLGLAFVSLWKNQKRGVNYFFALLAVALMLKEYSHPLINWIGHLPLLNLPRYAYHTPPLVAFSIAVLAGMGLRAVMCDRNLFKKALIFSAGLLLLAFGRLMPQQNTTIFPIALQAIAFCFLLLFLFQLILLGKDKKLLSAALAATLILALTAGELFLYIHREHPRRFASFPKVPYIEGLKSSSERIRSYGNFWAFYPSTATGFGVDDLGYFFALVPKRFVKFTNSVLVKDYFKGDLRPPALRAIPVQGKDSILDLLNVHYIIRPKEDNYEHVFQNFEDITKKYPLVYSGEVRVFQRPNAFPRAFIVHRVVFEPRESSALNLLEKIGPQLREVAVINSPQLPQVTAMLKASPVKDGSVARISKYGPNEVVLKVSMENPGFLILSDAFHPDWNVYVNGKKNKVWQTNYLLRGVLLPPGEFEVKFIFEPKSLAVGLWLSFFSLLVVIGLAHRIRKKES